MSMSPKKFDRRRVRRKDARARHLAKIPREPPPSSMTYVEDRGTLLDAPLEIVWDFMQGDKEFHPRAHATTLRNIKWKDLSEVTGIIRCEVDDGDGWRKMVARLTTIRPAVRIVEELEGPYAGTKMVFLYTPRGRKTAVDVLCYMRSSELSPREIRQKQLRALASAHAEDVPYLRRFARKQSLVQRRRS
jgi:hypothetical protein